MARVRTSSNKKGRATEEVEWEEKVWSASLHERLSPRQPASQANEIHGGTRCAHGSLTFAAEGLLRVRYVV